VTKRSKRPGRYESSRRKGAKSFEAQGISVDSRTAPVVVFEFLPYDKMIAVAVIAIVLVGMLLLTVFVCMRSTKEGFSMAPDTCNTNPSYPLCVSEMVRFAKEQGEYFDHQRLDQYVRNVACNPVNGDVKKCLRNLMLKWKKSPDKRKQVMDSPDYKPQRTKVTNPSNTNPPTKKGTNPSNTNPPTKKGTNPPVNKTARLCSDLPTCVDAAINIAKQAGDPVDRAQLANYLRQVECSKTKDTTKCLQQFVDKWQNKSYRDKVKRSLNGINSTQSNKDKYKSV
jgi:hypothetical protein